MFILKKFLLYLTALIFAAGAELIRLKPTWWLIIIIVILLFLVFAIWNFSKKTINRRFLNFLITPVVFCLGVLVFLFFIEKNWLYHIIVILTAILLYLFLEQILKSLFRGSVPTLHLGKFFKLFEFVSGLCLVVRAFEQLHVFAIEFARDFDCLCWFDLCLDQTIILDQ